MKKTWFAVSAVLALAACAGISDPVVCPAVISMSVVVTVQDSLSGANLTPGATVVLRNGSAVDSVTAPAGPLTAMGVGEGRTGTFTLTVRQTGYKVWTKSVTVPEGRCGAQTVNVTARLQPAA